MARLRFTILIIILLSNLFSLGQVAGKKSYFDGDSNPSNSNNGAYFIVEGKVDDTIWERDFYRSNGPLIKIEQYKSNDLKIKSGKFFFYNFSGTIKSFEYFSDGKENGIWINYNEKGLPLSEKTCEKGVFINEVNFELGDKTINDSVEALKHINTKSEFPGASAGWNNYLNRFHIPDDAINNHINGNVIVGFTIDTTGKVKNVYILKSLEYSVDLAAIKNIVKSPKWKPAKRDGLPIEEFKFQPYIIRAQ